MSVGASGAVAGGRPLLIVTGLYSEARIAAGAGMTVICSSSDPDQLRAQLDTFDHASVRGIISFGIAGGLDPSLQARRPGRRERNHDRRCPLGDAPRR